MVTHWPLQVEVGCGSSRFGGGSAGDPDLARALPAADAERSAR